jgi:glycosyltransferase A (GT-A) superfamily protein (DUF2064 family)/SAM-dependent methyltransferase
VTARIVVIAKAPVAGRVKTRLTPPLSPPQAATLARAALEDTLHTVLEAGARIPPLLALRGEPGPWLPAGFEVVPQRGDGLAERIAAAFVDARGPALLIGMDTPQVGRGLLRSAIRWLDGRAVDAVLGTAVDGGWWALGLREPDPRALLEIPMSTSWTGSMQRERLASLGLRTRELPVLRDVDTFDDVLEVARLAPRGRFARAVGRIAGAPDGRVRADPPDVVLRCEDGHTIPLPVRRWTAEPTSEERHVLGLVAPPVLDVGCGPGRHVATLLGRGIPALGIDPAPSAVTLARGRGAAVLQRSVFDRLPRPGAWGTALLLDGNVGIGGDPVRLLRRVADLLRPAGRILVEVEAPGVGVRRTRARVETSEGAGPWFDWSRVGAGAVHGVARDAGSAVCDVWEAAGRWFARLVTDGRSATIS